VWKAAGAVLRSEDLSARLGGDEFAVLCRQLSPAGARDLADRIERAPREPILAHGVVVGVGASVGVAFAPDCVDGEDLLVRTDDAMFAIKKARRFEKAY
jgi:diguanylate cyclase (GGDEF)-like protein